MGIMNISKGNITARVNLESQQLCSLRCGNREWMHGASLPQSEQTPEDALGWKQSELIMFPIVGPVKDNFLDMDGIEYPMAQHGISRHLPWELIEHNGGMARFRQSYLAGTPVVNSKTEQKLVWPFSYRMEKTYEVTGSGLKFTVTVRNESEAPMRYSTGWHPAFKIHNPYFSARFADGDRRISLLEITEVSLKNAVVLSCHEVTLVDSGTLKVTTDAPYIMLWSPAGSKMVCIEPTTQYPVWDGIRAPEGFLLERKQTRTHQTQIDLSGSR